MRRSFTAAAVFLVSVFAAAFAQPADRLATFFEKIRVQPNGDADWTWRSEVKILADTAIRPSQDQEVIATSETETLKTLEAYVIRKDGSKDAVAPNDIEVVTHPGNATKTFKRIRFPSLHIGDTIVVETVSTAKTGLPGGFLFNRKSQIPFDLGEDVEIFVPSGQTLTVVSDGYDVRQEAAPGGTIWHLRHPAGTSFLPTGEYVSPLDHGPRIFASTFKDYDAEAAAYAAIIQPKAVVTPTLQAKADEITAGVSDKREQARLLFNWVRDNITYETKAFGMGGVVPRDTATETIALKRGDCKAQVVLYTTLLKAKGIEGYMSTVHATNSYSLPKAATLATFTHVVTWLPAYNIYADTTSRYSVFGETPFTLYGKPVMHVGYKGPAIDRVPLMQAADNGIVSETTMTVDAKGRISGDLQVKGDGVPGGLLQQLALMDAAKNPERLAERILKGNHLEAAEGSFTFPPANAPMTGYAYSGHFADRNSITGRSFAMPRGLAVARMESSNVVGPIADKAYKDADPVACYAVHAVELYTLQVPAGFKPASLPPDQTVKTAHVDYALHWSFDGDKLGARHELTTTFESPLCGGAVRSEVLSALAKIGDAFKQELSLVRAN